MARRGFRIRVGGGIRDFEAGKELLDAGVSKIIVGTKANPEFLSFFPRDRVVVALDNKRGELLSHGWQQAASGTRGSAEWDDRSVTAHPTSGCAIERKIEELSDYCSGFLVTFVENEGRMTGMCRDRVQALQDAVTRSVGTQKDAVVLRFSVHHLV